MRYFFILIFFSSSLFAQQNTYDIYVKIVESNFKANKFSSNVNIATELSFFTSRNLSSLVKATRPFYRAKTNGLERVYVLSMNDNVNINELISEIKSNPQVELVERKQIRQIISTPNDPSTSSQWFLNKIEAFDAWDIPVSSGNVTVAVVDNAIQVNHVDLAANMLPGYDASDLDNDPSPPNDNFSHGTHVAGIVSAVTNNNLGIAAAANNRVKILPIKATPDNGNPNGIYTGYEGIQWAIDNNADIISLSWGGGGYSQIEQDVINEAHNQGIVVLASAGNANDEQLSYPAAYNHVISVASLDDNDTKSSFSSYGNTIDISAPGRGILSTIPTNQYDSFNGTSMATPLVASVCGYLLSVDPTLSPDAVEALIKRTSDDIELLNPTFVNKLGAGRVNMYKLIACKNSNLNEVLIEANSFPSICSGDSIILNIISPSILPVTATYQWFKDGQAISGETKDSLVVKSQGSFYLKVIEGACEISSDILTVNDNTINSPTPLVNYFEAFYCDAPSLENELVATASNCNFSGPSQFTYTGPVVGFDANEKSGDYPTAIVEGLAGTIQDLSVSVTWQKKDVFSYNSCGDIDAGGIPYNEEVELKLISPVGEEVVLIARGTYAVGTSTSGLVTTIFTPTGATIPTNSLPSSGTFAPAQSFNSFIGELPNGTWTLYANDDSFVDPLCVLAFSITIQTNALSGSPEFTWWDSPTDGNLVYTGKRFNPATTVVGENTLYLQSKCEGACPSPRVKANYYIKPVPYIVAFPLNVLYTNPNDVDQLLNENINFSTTDSTFTILRPGINGTTYGNTFNFNSPLESPVTVCEQTCYVVVATGCPSGAITWNGGVKGEGDIICLNGNFTTSAVCGESLPCPSSGSNVFEFKKPDQNLALTRRISQNAYQITNGQSITSSQFIDTPSFIEYRANNNVMLMPGFEVAGDTSFSASIDGCDN